MDSYDLFNGYNYNPMICGEESFGTGSNHVREKDGMWAVLAWLSILQFYNQDHSAPFVHVQDIVLMHWNKYGRNFYCRYDYEGVPSASAANVISHLRKLILSQELVGTSVDNLEVVRMDEFEYVDPIDGSISRQQGIRILLHGGSRIVFRLRFTIFASQLMLINNTF